MQWPDRSTPNPPVGHGDRRQGAVQGRPARRGPCRRGRHGCRPGRTRRPGSIGPLPAVRSTDLRLEPVTLLPQRAPGGAVGGVETPRHVPQRCDLTVELLVRRGAGMRDVERRGAPPLDPPEHPTRVATPFGAAQRECGQLVAVPGRQRSQLQVAEQRPMLVDRVEPPPARVEQGAPVAAEVREQRRGQPSSRPCQARAGMPRRRRLARSSRIASSSRPASCAIRPCTAGPRSGPVPVRLASARRGLRWRVGSRFWRRRLSTVERPGSEGVRVRSRTSGWSARYRACNDSSRARWAHTGRC